MTNKKEEYTTIRIRCVARNTIERWQRKQNFKDLSTTIDAMVKFIKECKAVGELK